MAKVKVYNVKAQEVGSMNLADDLFAIEYNEPLIHEVIVAYNANQRQGTKSTLTRSEVRGHAKKPWRQKGTGRARQGSTTGPESTRCEIVFAPKPRDFSKKVNKQKKRLALLSALSQKIRQNEVVVLDKFAFDKAKTKDAQSFVDAFGFKGNTLIVSDKNSKETILSVANIPTLDVEEIARLNTYDVVASKNLVITQSAIKSIEEAYAE